MKTKLSLFALLSIFCFQTVSAQNVGWFYGSTDGSDAIDLKLGYRNSGSSNNFTLSSRYVNGAAYLDYRSSAWSNWTTWERNSSTGTKNILRFGGSDGLGHYLTIFDKDSGATSMVKLNANGDSFFSNDLGIGTTSPSSTLHIHGDGGSASGYSISNSSESVRGYFRDNTADADYVITYLGSGEAEIELQSDGDVILAQAGNVGIGTTTPGNELEVNGTIRSKEVIVEATGWPDFVFYPDYDLLPLEDLEQFIVKNNHLPEVPSEAEVNENGVKLGEMDATLLQKIEELTLYMIEQNKINKQQQELIDVQSEMIEKLKQEVSELHDK
ncbi:MAG: hypothetical protein ED557_01940 [Balneola sp.]|nr:MAG: hypothetical protein ED557_01940 [Balneola sp.]